MNGISSGAVPPAASDCVAMESFAARVRAKLLRAGIQAPESMVSAAMAVATEAEVKRVQRADALLTALSIELQVLYERQRLRRERQRAMERANARSVPIESYAADLVSWQEKLEAQVLPLPLGRPATIDAACEASLPPASAARTKRGMGAVPCGSMPAPTPILSRCGAVSDSISMTEGIGATTVPLLGVAPLISRCQSASVADPAACDQGVTTCDQETSSCGQRADTVHMVAGAIANSGA